MLVCVFDGQVSFMTNGQHSVLDKPAKFTTDQPKHYSRRSWILPPNLGMPPRMPALSCAALYSSARSQNKNPCGSGHFVSRQ